MDNNKSEIAALNEEELDGVAGGSGSGDVEVLSDTNDERYQKVSSLTCPNCGGMVSLLGTVCYKCSCCGSGFVLL